MARVPFRGEKVDIGGRGLRTVRAGLSSAGPLVVLEHGAFGCAADWAVVQERLAAKGLRSLAYDRAGLGHSDPGPEPRDGRAINDDLEALLDALGETGPLVLVGHSMGGLMVRLFALERTRPVVGVVLVDAVTPEALDLPGSLPAIQGFGQMLRMAGHGARIGLMGPLSLIGGNRIGVPGEAGVEKRRIFASAPHAHGAAAEVNEWPNTSRMAGAAEMPSELPVSVVTAGSPQVRGAIQKIQELAAKRSKHGYVEHVHAAGHANLLGPRFADAILRGINHTLEAEKV